MSVLVQDAATRQPVLNTEIVVQLRHVPNAPEGPNVAASVSRTRPRPVAQIPLEAYCGSEATALGRSNQRLTASHAQSQNRLLYSALTVLPLAGEWSCVIEVNAASRRGTVATALRVAPAESLWSTHRAVIALPFVVVALFVLHRRLQARQGDARPDPRQLVRYSRGTGSRALDESQSRT